MSSTVPQLFLCKSRDLPQLCRKSLVKAFIRKKHDWVNTFRLKPLPGEQSSVNFRDGSGWAGSGMHIDNMLMLKGA